MSHFQLDRRLPSVDLPKSLVAELEAYILEEVPEEFLAEAEEIIAQGGYPDETPDEFFPTQQDIRDSYGVTVTDDMGEHTLTSIDDFRPERFRNTTERVELKARVARISGRLRISFSRDYQRTSIRIELQSAGGRARGRAVGMYKDLLRILEPHKNFHWTVHPHRYVTPSFFVGGAAVLTLSGVFIPQGTVTQSVAAWSGLTILLGAFLPVVNVITASTLVPYTHFDTQRYNRLRSISVKVWGAILSGAVSLAVGAFIKAILG